MSTVAPTQIVILGGGGDLSKRKLLPALFDLFLKERLPTEFNIIGMARSPRSDAEYRTFVTDSLLHHGHEHHQEKILEFCTHINYIAGSFTDDSSYSRLLKSLESNENALGVCNNKLFYLAVPPEHYEIIFEKLHQHCMSTPCSDDTGWTRILVEKPFGSDLNSAQALDEKLSELFSEEQIFRIDHYLAKEAVQNILALRFANTLLTAPWNNEGIESVYISMYENINVSTRGAFYDSIGALRDVGQNHLLQLLALTAMRAPKELNAKSIRKERERILEALKPIDIDQIAKNVVRGQYMGYQDTPGVNSESVTETFFELVATLNLKEWIGVPFYISSGKALDRNEVSIHVIFKGPHTSPFSGKGSSSQPNQNSITLTISPEQKIDLTLNAKTPGLSLSLESRTLSFTCQSSDDEITNSYEKVLLDCIEGDQTLFTKTEEVLASWRFITPILDTWLHVPLQHYEQGSSGPEQRLVQ